MSHSVGHGRAHPDRRHIHDDVGELEHRLRQALAEHEHGAALLLTYHGQRGGKNQAEDYDLQHRAIGDRLRNVLRENVQNGVLPTKLGNRNRFCARRRGQLNANACFAQVDGRKAEEESDGGDNLEVDDRAQSETSNLSQVGMSGDADHQRCEDQGCDDGLDQPQEDQREYPQIGCDVGEVVSNLRAQQHGNEDPCRKVRRKQP